MSRCTKESVSRANNFMSLTESGYGNFDKDGDFTMVGSFGDSIYISPENIKDLYQAIQLLEFDNEH